MASKDTCILSSVSALFLAPRPYNSFHPPHKSGMLQVHTSTSAQTPHLCSAVHGLDFK